jgi:uncharacterized membrane protein (DUF485 family)
MERAPGPTLTHTSPMLSTDSEAADAAHRSQRLQILATEHWSLLATRSMSWNESFSRASMFLTLLSGATVALALVAQATRFGQGFVTFALLLLPLVLGVGWTTFVRLGEVNNEDAYWVTGMNRLRKAYLEMEPELEPYFVTGTTDDTKGLMRTYATHPGGIGLHGLITTPATVAFVNSAIFAVLAAIVAMEWMGMAVLPAGPVVGAGAFLLSIVVHAVFAFRGMREYERHQLISTPAEFTGAKRGRSAGNDGD